MRLFISSTCYDLLDLRSELEVFFRASRITPIMSDSAVSDFPVDSGNNSIETCLSNVRNCDAFLIILSNRYGRPIPGYSDLSATHLEYLEAVKSQKPIHMFVRDRLEGDFGVWHKNEAVREQEHFKLNWCSKGHWQIFELLAAHRKLSANESRNNWFWTFRDSVDLKERLSNVYKGAIAASIFRRLFENGRVPLIEIKARIGGYEPTAYALEMTVRNLSEAVAVDPTITFQRSDGPRILHSLTNKEEAIVRLKWARPPGGANLEIEYQIAYSVLEGQQFADDGIIRVVWLDSPRGEPRITNQRLRRRYVGTADELLMQ